MALVDVYLTDELKSVVDRANAKLLERDPEYIAFKFFFGEDEHVIKAMKDMKANGDTWNPLCAAVLPIDIYTGRPAVDRASIPRIVMAKITDPLKPPEVRQETIIKPFIIPFYKEFLYQCTKQKSFAIMGNQIEHRQRIRYGTQTAAQGFTEYIDGIELLDLILNIKQNCL